MCATCGCGAETGVRVITFGAAHEPSNGHPHAHTHRHEPGHEHEPGHAHGHEPGHAHEHGHQPAPAPPASRELELEVAVLAKNDEQAERNRGWLARHGVVAINVMSSPGSGKTTLLERTISAVGDDLRVAVIEGDQETTFDARRIRATGAEVVQVNTGAGCHLDAEMIERGLSALAPPAGTVVVVENVGNLVCPALFDLGESSRVVVMSVTEGADKPLKYPHMFRRADVVVLNKIDLLPYVDFDTEAFAAAVAALRPQVRIIACSATTGSGMDAWLAWLRHAAAVAIDAA
ncbi:MAG: hydrogenase nickel incorporation protein HypB [Actinomycetota bacterium]|nr:hydrogenase nickel incorporation protein HypB [Actinomycetota bacterium]